MSLLVTAHERYARFGSRMAIGVVPAVGRLVRSSTWPVIVRYGRDRRAQNVLCDWRATVL